MTNLVDVERDDDYEMFVVYCHGGPHQGKYLNRWIEHISLPQEDRIGEDGTLFYERYETAVLACAAYIRWAEQSEPEFLFCQWAGKLLRAASAEKQSHEWLEVSNLVEMCEKIPTFEDSLKRHRWIGFIQAGLLANGLVGQAELRDKSSELFAGGQAENQQTPQEGLAK